MSGRNGWKKIPMPGPPAALPNVLRAPAGSWWIDAQLKPREQFYAEAARYEHHMQVRGVSADQLVWRDK
jgi:hypothetical protein